MTELALSRRQYQEFEKIALGAFAPLSGFMNEDEFTSVVGDMRLPSGDVFPLPVVLDLDREEAARIRGANKVALTFGDQEVGEFAPASVFSCDKQKVARAVFGTADAAHPGVSHFLAMGEIMVGGAVRLKSRAKLDTSRYELTPEETRRSFADLGWRSIVGFQTRNVPHRAHEYLQRVALESHDGLFIQPLVGRKKVGDYTPEAIMTGYQTLIEQFYPRDRVVLGILTTAMRYAGPREAIFHAIIRRNYGCTHFIVGRDHAGVGDYYGKYEAHDLTARYDGELGIEILRLSGPYHCALCDGIVTDRTCPHALTRSDAVREIAGTDIRAMLNGGRKPDPHIMRPEIIESLVGVPLFIEENET
jgi:sulfate adenylyltransferase